jgi:hypothetical protein
VIFYKQQAQKLTPNLKFDTRSEQEIGAHSYDK